MTANGMAAELTRRKSVFGTAVFLFLIAAALGVRFFLAWEGGSRPERITRPDTPSYFDPARSLASGGGYRSTGRAPGFPAVAAGVIRCFGVDSALPLALLLSCFSAATVGVVFLTGYCWRSARLGLWAAALIAWNLTALANAPMLLADTLFGFLAALQFLFFVCFFRKRRVIWFAAMTVAAALGTLVKPVNGPWILPALVILWFLPRLEWKKKLAASLIGTLLFFALTAPWMARNAALGAGFCVDTNTGAMLHQNGAMLLAEVNGTTYEEEKRKLRDEMERVFLDRERFPDEKSREAWRLKRLREIVGQHPFVTLKQHFNWYTLLPDAPTFLELFGVTRSDRGTMNILRSQGIFKAVSHYFDGAYGALLLLIPLLSATLLLYAGCFCEIVARLWKFRRQWYFLLLFLAFGEYYLFLPGAISAPRYQLPALPLFCLFAALSLTRLIRHMRSQR